MNEPYPLYGATVELTLRCNMRCLHCGSCAGKARPDELSNEEFLAFFADLAKLGCQEVCLLGGEPLLHPSWEELARGAGCVGLRLIIISNGYLVDAALVERLGRLGALDRVGISLDGASPEVHDALRGRKGSFERALQALFLLRDAGIETGAITTVSRRNLNELSKIKDILLGQDISWQIQTASDHGGRFESRDLLSEREFYAVGSFISSCRRTYPVSRLPVAGSHDIGYCSNVLTCYSELPDWKGCAAGLYTVGLASDGSVKGCLALSDDFIEDNIRRRSFAEIWRDRELFRRNRRFSTELLEGFCATCRHGSVCRGGCADKAASLTGSPYGDPYCFYRLEEEGIVAGAGPRIGPED